MKLLTYFKVLSFLSRISRDPGDIPMSVPATDGAYGAVYDRYEAAKGGGGSRRSILLHGITFEGRRDIRLMNFASALTRYGVSCLVPELPGLASGRFIKEDLEAIRSLVKRSSLEKGSKTVIVGFSMGASYGLLAAADKETAEAVSHVIAFGPYHSLSELIDYWKVFSASNPTGAEDRDNLIYLALVCAYTMRSLLCVDESLAVSMRSLLDRYCNHATMEEKEVFYRDHLKKIDAAAIIADDLGPGVAQALSPEGSLGAMKARVHCIHDVNDSLVPADHSRRIMAELTALGRTGDRLLCTTLLSHVSAAPVARIGEVFSLCAALGPLFEEGIYPA